jgi:hypothetical protein
VTAVAYPGFFFFGGGGSSTNSVEDRGQRERGSEGGSTLVRVSAKFSNFQISETRILIRLLRLYFPRNWKFDSALSKFRNFEGGRFDQPKTPLPPVRHYVTASLVKVVSFTTEREVFTARFFKVTVFCRNKGFTRNLLKSVTFLQETLK